MHTCDVPIHLQDHNYFKSGRTSVRHRPSRNCPCRRDSEGQNSTPPPQRSVATSRLPRKRKRSSEPCPSAPPAEAPGKLDPVQRPRSPISPADLPPVSTLPPSPLPSTADTQPTSTSVHPSSPLRIHNHSVEDYQKIYHEVVDDMLSNHFFTPPPPAIPSDPHLSLPSSALRLTTDEERLTATNNSHTPAHTNSDPAIPTLSCSINSFVTTDISPSAPEAVNCHHPPPTSVGSPPRSKQPSPAALSLHRRQTYNNRLHGNQQQPPLPNSHLQAFCKTAEMRHHPPPRAASHCF
ncbi:uncharacterized protein AKAME5_000039000 [Lates japonicus]|uniref:Uncharacterized protein n=1 Tax=Lates japonicus TaxID=270547 RepID=A0AAD3M1R8_LATJO|nr:uncharacterized protein AKAME5_000039000 [Lates japonicus]